jgi:hypothetical protein
MTLAWRPLELLAAVVLVGIRLWFHRDPLDWIVALGVCWALLSLDPRPAWRNGVLGAGAFALTGLYLKGQIIHMLAVSNLLP